MKLERSLLVIALMAAAAIGAHPDRSTAHCDTLDGPVVAEARIALEKKDVTPVLKWVAREHEREIREAFAKTLAVREKDAEARELADMYFFETLVRVHREGEGAPYTGLKPAGSVDAELVAADKALDGGSVDALADEIAAAVRDGIKRRFSEAASAKKHSGENVGAGREYVAAYVEYVHFIENIHNLVAATSAHQHGEGHTH